MDISQVPTLVDWSQVYAIVGANIGLIAIVFGTNIMLYLNLDKKIDESRKETNDLIRAIHDEMKDFHGRLCGLEAKGKK